MTKKNYQGHFARKRFGQNFLRDDFIIESIVNAIAPKNSDHLIEIGPGLGALTLPVLERVDKLTVIEIDRDLARRHRNNSKLNVIEQDALTINFDKYFTANNGKVRIFGNLPYNISTPLMFHLFKFEASILDMHFMLQKEVVDRMAAAPNSKNYGRLSVMMQYYCHIIPIIEVPPSAFIPSPKVNSAVVKLIPHEIKPYQVSSTKTLSNVVTAAFGQRRKTIRNSLSQFFSSDELTSLNISPELRAENLSIEQYCTLANAYVQEA